MLSQTISSIWKLDRPESMLDEMERLRKYFDRYRLGDFRIMDSLICPVCGGKTSKVKTQYSHAHYRLIIDADIPGSDVLSGWMCMSCKSSLFLSSYHLLGQEFLSFTVLRDRKPVFRFTFSDSHLESLISLYRAVLHILEAYRSHPFYQVIAYYHMSFIKGRTQDMADAILEADAGLPDKSVDFNIGYRAYPAGQ